MKNNPLASTDEIGAPSDATDWELIERLRSESGASRREAFETLLRRCQGLVASTCLRITGDREDAADASQEALVKICRALPTFRNECRFSTWAYLVARTVCLEFVRKRARREDRESEVHVNEPAIYLDPGQPLQNQDQRDRMLGIIRSHVTEEESRILILHHVDGLSMKKISKILNLTNRSGARAFLTNAKRKLRREGCLDELRQAMAD